MSKPIRKAAGFVIYRKNKNELNEYLLMKASGESHHWTPPKGTSIIFLNSLHLCYWFMLCVGHLEKNETAMDAAIRETEEESGIKIADVNIHHNFEKILRVIKT